MIKQLSKILGAVCLGVLCSACKTSTPPPSLPSSPPSSTDIFVGFENPAYRPGDIYNRQRQAMDWTVTRNPTRMDTPETSISDEAAASGKRSLKVIYKANEQAVKQARWEIAEAQSYTLEYKVMFAPDFNFNGQDRYKRTQNGGKLPGLAGSGERGVICAGGMECYPGRGFTARLMWRTDGEAVLYLYDYTKSQNGRTYGEDIAFEGEGTFIPGQWHHIRQTVTLNTAGQADGRIDIDMDGVPAVRLKNREIVAAGEGIDMVLFSTFFGGNSPPWFPAIDQTAYFDDFKVMPSK